MPIDLSKLVETPFDQNNVNVPLMSEYDATWGFYTIQQSVTFEYNDTKISAISKASVTLSGIFTINGENEEDVSGKDISDEDKFNALFAKYQSLRSLLVSKTMKSAPINFAYFGTAQDERCVVLPSKLKSSSGGRVYMIPTGISTANMISPNELAYTVTLVEAIKYPCKVSLGGRIIHDAVVTVVCRKPRITPRYYAFANGGEFYFTGRDNRKIKVEGLLGAGEDVDSTKTFYAGQLSYIDTISEQGYADIQLVKIDGTSESFGRVKLGPHSISSTKGLGESRISVEGEQTDEE